eukprot:1535190-Amphidinium_carterae.1
MRRHPSYENRTDLDLYCSSAHCSDSYTQRVNGLQEKSLFCPDDTRQASAPNAFGMSPCNK